MRTHILITLSALILTACSSNQVARVENPQNDYGKSQHARMFEGPGSRIR